MILEPFVFQQKRIPEFYVSMHLIHPSVIWHWKSIFSKTFFSVKMFLDKMRAFFRYERLLINICPRYEHPRSVSRACLSLKIEHFVRFIKLTNNMDYEKKCTLRSHLIFCVCCTLKNFEKTSDRPRVFRRTPEYCLPKFHFAKSSTRSAR